MPLPVIIVVNRGVHNTNWQGVLAKLVAPPGWAASGKLTGWMGVGQVICPGAGEGLLCCTREDCTDQNTRSQTITPVDDPVTPGLEKATRGIAVTHVAYKILSSASR